jgi:LysM repeat protein
VNIRILLAALCAAVLCACGSGSNQTAGGSSARELKDPRTVPSATVPAQVPSPIPAVDVTQGPTAGASSTPPPNVYVVKSGDTPAGIAAALGVDLDALLRANNITDPRSLRVGQQLNVPRPAAASATPARGAGGTPSPVRGSATAPPTRAGGSATRSPATATRTPPASATPTAGAASGSTYTVQAGDTGCEIARKLNVPLTALAEANRTSIAGLASLQIGQTLNVPAEHGPPGC